MVVFPLTEYTGVTPSIAMIYGQMGVQNVIDQFNEFAGGHGVMFGQASDPYADRYKAFMQAVVEPIKETFKIIQNVSNRIINPDAFVEIQSTEDLQNVAKSMYIPIMSMPRLSDLLRKEKVYGFGLDVAQLPEEDVYGRLINNHSVTLNPADGSIPEEITWEYASTDPDIEEDDLEIIERSRAWVDHFLDEQLCSGGERLDPTNKLKRMSL